MGDIEGQVLQWMADSSLRGAIMGNFWVFPTLETLHFIGVCLLFGSLLLVDVRLMGFLRQVPIGSALSFLPITIGAFLLLLATGIAFVFSNPFNYWANPAFKLKLLFIFLGGLNAILFTLFEHRKMIALGADEDTNGFTKVAAGLSLAFWTLVLVCGRSMPLFDTGQG
jgi:hypothetical protein